MIRRAFLLVALSFMCLTSAPQANAQTTATAMLAGGCFWCLEHDMKVLPGVISAVSGYAGGSRPNPTYQTYNKTDSTYRVPHIEVVRITYDPARVNYDALLNFFLRRIDPTDGDGQFCDRGPGYRPAIFVADERESEIARRQLTEAQNVIGEPIRVEVLPLAPFTEAEGYHQNFAEKNPAHYQAYRNGCGRDARVRQVWKGK